MDRTLKDVRKDGFVIFSNDNKKAFILIRTLDDLVYYVIGSENGWESIEHFERITGYKRDQMIGKAICYPGGKLWFAEDEDWFNNMDKARIEAVFNKYVLDSDKLSVEEAGKVIIDCFYHICGKNVRGSIKETVDRGVSYLQQTTTEDFIERMRRQIIGDFHIWMS